MIIIFMVAALCLMAWLYTKRTPVEVYALTENNGDVLVYKTSMWTRALYQGQDELIYRALVKVVKNNVRIDGWLRGVDFGIWDGNEYLFVVRYEDVLTNNKHFTNS